MSPHVAIVTGDRAPALTDNGKAVASALNARGVDTEPAVWHDDSVEWTDFDAALVRSCWNYHHEIDAFHDWLDARESQGVTLLNPYEVVRWNIHKFYLRDLQQAGVSVLPTAFVDRDSDTAIGSILEEHGWEEAVVKPAVGTSSEGVWRTSRADAESDQRRFAEMVADRDMLVQQYAPEVREGEHSLFFFATEYSHAISNRPAPDDFRTHHSFGGTSRSYDPPEHVREQARDVLLTAADVVSVDPTAIPYARVDGVVREGDFCLMELELVEPYLSLDAADDGAAMLADAVETAYRRRTGEVSVES